MGQDFWARALVSVLLLTSMSACKSTPSDHGTDGVSPADTRPTNDVARDARIAVDEAPDDQAPPQIAAYDEAMFLATHNSYSGGSRGTIRAQLDSGVRFIELDVHDDNLAMRGYEVGHDAPGHEVALGNGNPADARLTSWLEAIQAWRVENPDHVPLTIGLDLKDDLEAAGTLGDFEELVVETFGEALFTEADGAWPSIEAMRGRVVVVLSGDGNSRLAYHEGGRGRMWSELQRSGPAQFEGDARVRFFAADAFGTQDVAWAERRRADGGIVRLWKFNLPNVVPDPPPNFPATDGPDLEWYREYCAGCVR